MNQRFRVLSSPCIRVCKIDPGIGLCTGCGRTLAEIALWSQMTEPERTAVMSVLPVRLENARRSLP